MLAETSCISQVSGLCSFFTLAYRKVVSQGEEMLRKDFCQVSQATVLFTKLMVCKEFV